MSEISNFVKNVEETEELIVNFFNEYLEGLTSSFNKAIFSIAEDVVKENMNTFEESEGYISHKINSIKEAKAETNDYLDFKNQRIACICAQADILNKRG